MRDPETGNSKGYAFINFASFEASDAAIEAMNGQYLCNRPITISYAFKKESKGERHGSAAGMYYIYNIENRKKLSLVLGYSLYTICFTLWEGEKEGIYIIFISLFYYAFGYPPSLFRRYLKHFGF